MKSILTLQAIWHFAEYFLSGLALLIIFTRLYIFFTPYNEIEEIKKGEKAPALSLFGAMIGFLMPILAMSYCGINFIEYLLWSIAAGVIQLACFKVLYWIMPKMIEADNTAAGVFYAGVSICVGAINAFSLIP
jgi:putative membrane protein